MLKAVLARLVTLSGDSLSDSLFVYLEVGAYIHPLLLSNILQVVRSIPPGDSVFIYTARTITVSSLNKRAPLLGITSEMIRKAEHQMDILIFRSDFLQILQEQLPEGAIAAKLHDIILSIAFSQHVRVVDLTPAGIGRLRCVMSSVCGEEETRVNAAGKAAAGHQHAHHEGEGVAVLLDERCGSRGFAAAFDEANSRGRAKFRELGREFADDGVSCADDAAVLYDFVWCVTKKSRIVCFSPRRASIRSCFISAPLRASMRRKARASGEEEIESGIGTQSRCCLRRSVSTRPVSISRCTGGR